jgi:hypothetical protein
MLVVLSKSHEGFSMPDTEHQQTNAAAKDEHGPSDAQLAAVVEAAYILEALRK